MDDSITPGDPFQTNYSYEPYQNNTEWQNELSSIGAMITEALTVAVAPEAAPAASGLAGLAGGVIGGEIGVDD